MVDDSPSNPVIIPDNELICLANETRNERERFYYPNEYEGHFEGVLISYGEILKRTKDLAEQIHRKYKGERPCLVCVLKGSIVFFSHLTSALQLLRQGYTMEFLRASSYEGTSSTGSVRVWDSDTEALRGQRVILVEDIVDTGITLSRLLSLIRDEAKPKSLEVCSLVEKRLSEKRVAETAKTTRESNNGNGYVDVLETRRNLRVNYVGFSVPDVFIVGHGLDYNEKYRDLRDIYVMSKKGIHAP